MNKQIDMFQSFRNTTPNKVYQQDALQNVEERKLKNKSQNQIILDFLIENKGQGFTAWAIKKRVGMSLITSVRRALTTLYKADLIEKMEETTIERQGERNHYYRVR